MVGRTPSYPRIVVLVRHGKAAARYPAPLGRAAVGLEIASPCPRDGGDDNHTRAVGGLLFGFHRLGLEGWEGSCIARAGELAVILQQAPIERLLDLPSTAGTARIRHDSACVSVLDYAAKGGSLGAVS